MTLVDHTDYPRPVSAADARSWLLVGAGAPTTYLPTATTDTPGADVTIVDLEDGTLPSARPSARRRLLERIALGPEAWVRINPAGTSDWDQDLAALGEASALQGIVLAKCETAEDVHQTSARLRPGVHIVALVESALGIEHAFSIASAPGTLRLAFGSGDFRRDTGAHAAPLALAYARSRLVVASRAAGLPGPIDGPSPRPAPEHLVEDLSTTRSMGMTGKLCLRASEADIINRELRPSAAETEWATKTIKALGGDGSRVSSGADIPKLARAQNIQRLAAIFADKESQ